VVRILGSTSIIIHSPSEKQVKDLERQLNEQQAKLQEQQVRLQEQQTTIRNQELRQKQFDEQLQALRASRNKPERFESPGFVFAIFSAIRMFRFSCFIQKCARLCRQWRFSFCRTTCAWRIVISPIIP
jgi:hypothetical protein